MDTQHPLGPAQIAQIYVTAFGDKRFAELEKLFAPDIRLTGPARTVTGAAELLTTLRRISAILVRNDIRRIFADGDEACVIYDLVTDTAIGSVPVIEWLRVEDGRIRSIDLYYDQLPWKAVAEELTRRLEQRQSA